GPERCSSPTEPASPSPPSPTGCGWRCSGWWPWPPGPGGSGASGPSRPPSCASPALLWGARRTARHRGDPGLTEAVLHAVASIGVPGLYLLVAALAFAETAAFVGLAMPGEVALILAGAAVRCQGSLGLAIAVGALGAVAGDSTSFFLGWRFGRPPV